MAIVAELWNLILDDVIRMNIHVIKVTEDVMMVADKVEVLTVAIIAEFFGIQTEVLLVLLNSVEDKEPLTMIETPTCQYENG